MSVNAPKAGTIVKLLANEEDTVVPGQDLFVIEEGEVSQCTSSFFCILFLSQQSFGLLLLASTPAPPPPKEEKGPSETESKPKPKDAEEPSDQQVDKKLPPPPKPSDSDKKAPKVEKESSKEKAPKKEKEAVPAAPKPAVGSRNETRVRTPHCLTTQLYQNMACR